jgi:arylformamidase
LENNKSVKYSYLSYYIDEKTPLYGGEHAVFIDKRSQISKGASSNTKYLKLPNHTGTHIDFPHHFSDNGKKINDYNPEFWIFNNVFSINYEAKPEEIINEDKFSDVSIPHETDFLIINTSFGKYRGKEDYWKRNPGLAPELAVYIKDRCPDIKVVGFDFISVSSYQNRIIGREAHKKFLVEQDILLVEDMDLAGMRGIIKRIYALPWQINLIDGSPLTILAEYE